MGAICGHSQHSGAINRLLQRSGVGGRTLHLRNASVAQGIVTQQEFDFMRAHLGNARSCTLIPLDAVRAALSEYGQCERSEALVAALGIDRDAPYTLSCVVIIKSSNSLV